MDTAAEKAAQRKAGIAARRALSEADRAAANAALCRRIAQLRCFREAQTLLAYAAFGGEADLSALLAEAERLGKTVAYPVCGEGFTLTAAVPEPDGWEAGAYGIRTPILTKSRLLAPEELHLVLVPCTAFDAACRRVGMGKGYYDRYLPRCQNAVTLGVAFEVQRVERAAADPHDRQLESCETFLAELAGNAPVPGGGGAAALVGAAGAALGNMVGSLTVGKKKYAAVEADILALNERSAALRKRLEGLVQADAEAFLPLAAAYKLPKETPEQQAHRAAVLEEALNRACAVPLEIMAACCEGITLAEEYAAKGSVLALSDAGCAALFCKAALQAAGLNVTVNTRLMADKARAAALNAEAAALLADFVPKADRVYEQLTQQEG